ncbi:IS3 family transposase [Haloplasma contractile]|uniref:IS3 family transposase n=1 Tax=Haloplasma contractile TaxID=471825 RepID=UPI0038B7BBBB
MESLHSIIKKKYIYHTTFRTYEEARLGCFDYIEGWYNRHRIHGIIGNIPSHEFEMNIRNTALKKNTTYFISMKKNKTTFSIRMSNNSYHFIYYKLTII